MQISDTIRAEPSGLVARAKRVIEIKRESIRSHREIIAEAERNISEDEAIIAQLERDLAALTAGYAVLAERDAK